MPGKPLETRGLLHDLANVVTNVQRLADLALGALAADHPARADVEAIRRAGLESALLLRELLGGGTPPDGPVELGELLERQIAPFRRLHGGRVRFHLENAGARLPLRMGHADARRVLDNLVLNALEAMPDGGELRLRVSPAPTAGFALLEVADTGHGMEAGTLERIFEEDFTTRGAAGHGLGLAVVRRLVERAGGSIRVASAEGRGTAFRIGLPCADPPARAGGTILVVDDQPAVRSSVGDVLKESGYRVIEAGDGAQALRLLDGGVDLLLTDLHLPDMDGADLAAAATRARPGLKVVYMSGDSRGVDEGPCLQKPAAPEELRESVGTVLGSATAGDARAGPAR